MARVCVPTSRVVVLILCLGLSSDHAIDEASTKKLGRRWKLPQPERRASNVDDIQSLYHAIATATSTVSWCVGFCVSVFNVSLMVVPPPPLPRGVSTFAREPFVCLYRVGGIFSSLFFLLGKFQLYKTRIDTLYIIDSSSLYFGGLQQSIRLVSFQTICVMNVFNMGKRNFCDIL